MFGFGVPPHIVWSFWVASLSRPEFSISFGGFSNGPLCERILPIRIKSSSELTTIGLTRLLAIVSCLAPIYLAFCSPSQASGQDPFDLSSQQEGRPGVKRNQAAIARLPAHLRLVKDGTFTMASTLGASPISTYATDGSTAIGFDPELGRLVGESLGLKVESIPVAWADWPFGAIAGKYDAVISNVAVTEERKERFDFSTYRRGL